MSYTASGDGPDKPYPSSAAALPTGLPLDNSFQVTHSSTGKAASSPPPAGPVASATSASSNTITAMGTANPNGIHSTLTAQNAPSLVSPSTRSNTAMNAQNMAVARRVQQLLALQVDDGVRDLAAYIESASLFRSSNGDGRHKPLRGHRPDGSEDDDDDEEEISEDEGNEKDKVDAMPTSSAVRLSLEKRMMHTHRSFFSDLTALYESYQVASNLVSEITQRAEAMEKALAPTTTAVRDFVQMMSAAQAELEQVEQREAQVRVICDQLNFKAEDQELLLRGPVDSYFLEALGRARAVYRSSKEMISSSGDGPSVTASSRAYDVGIGTYTAMVAAMRQLMTFLVTPVAGNGSSVASSPTSNTVLSTTSSMSADSPELSSFYLRCIRVLYDYDLGTWRNMVQMVTDMRRSSVLRRYCHLLTTGSATTSAGMYRSGGQAAQGHGRGGPAAAASASLRPLEADLDKPLYFFRSLLAWMHQTIVAEMDLLSHFFFDTDSIQVLADASSYGSTNPPGVDEGEITLNLLMNRIFDHVTTHVETALQGVLDRYTPAVCNLPALPKRTSGSTGTGASAASPTGTGAALGSRLTSGLRRIWKKQETSPFSPSAIAQQLSTTEKALQKYVTATRSQQVQLSAAFLQTPLEGMKELFGLAQLFVYYHTATVVPLLGNQSKLAALLLQTGCSRVSGVFGTVTQHIIRHLTRGTIMNLTYNTRLQQLQETAAFEKRLHTQSTVYGLVPSPNTSRPSDPASKTSEEANEEVSSFVIHFLFAYQRSDVDVGAKVFKSSENLYKFLDKKELSRRSGVTEIPVSSPSTRGAPLDNATREGTTAGDREGGPPSPLTKPAEDPLSFAASHELDKTLSQLTLPASTELTCLLDGLKHMLMEYEQQEKVLHDMMEYQQQQQQQRQQEREDEGATQGRRDAAAHLSDVSSSSVERTSGRRMIIGTLRLLVQEYPMELLSSGLVAQRLDTVCQQILLLNAVQAIGSVVAMMEKGVVKKEEEEEGEKALLDADREVLSCLKVVRERTERYRETIVQMMSAAAIHHYFPVGLDADTDADDATLAQSVEGPTSTDKLLLLLREITYFGALVHRDGGLTLPLQTAIESEETRRSVSLAVRERIWSHYAALHAALLSQVMEEGGSADGERVNESMEPNPTQRMEDIQDATNRKELTEGLRQLRENHQYLPASLRELLIPAANLV